MILFVPVLLNWFFTFCCWKRLEQEKLKTVFFSLINIYPQFCKILSYTFLLMEVIQKIWIWMLYTPRINHVNQNSKFIKKTWKNKISWRNFYQKSFSFFQGLYIVQLLTTLQGCFYTPKICNETDETDISRTKNKKYVQISSFC